MKLQQNFVWLLSVIAQTLMECKVTKVNQFYNLFIYSSDKFLRTMLSHSMNKSHSHNSPA